MSKNTSVYEGKQAPKVGDTVVVSGKNELGYYSPLRYEASRLERDKVRLVVVEVTQGVKSTLVRPNRTYLPSYPLV